MCMTKMSCGLWMALSSHSSWRSNAWIAMKNAILGCTAELPWIRSDSSCPRDIQGTSLRHACLLHSLDHGVRQCLCHVPRESRGRRPAQVNRIGECGLVHCGCGIRVPVSGVRPGKTCAYGARERRAHLAVRVKPPLPVGMKWRRHDAEAAAHRF